jgi:hypothetical protein
MLCTRDNVLCTESFTADRGRRGRSAAAGRDWQNELWFSITGRNVRRCCDARIRTRRNPEGDHPTLNLNSGDSPHFSILMCADVMLTLSVACTSKWSVNVLSCAGSHSRDYRGLCRHRRGPLPAVYSLPSAVCCLLPSTVCRLLSAVYYQLSAICCAV